MFDDAEVAGEISKLMIEFSVRLNASVATVRDGCTRAEFEEYRAAVARLMSDMLLDVMNPIYARHPHLKPVELD
jgi:hypothetical protein